MYIAKYAVYEHCKSRRWWVKDVENEVFDWDHALSLQFWEKSGIHMSLVYLTNGDKTFYNEEELNEFEGYKC